MYEVSWGGADPLTGHDVTPNGPAMAGDPSGYFAASENMRHIFYRSAEAPAHLYELWSGGAVPSGRGDITPVFRLRAGGVVPFTVRVPAATACGRARWRGHGADVDAAWRLICPISTRCQVMADQ